MERPEYQTIIDVAPYSNVASYGDKVESTIIEAALRVKQHEYLYLTDSYTRWQELVELERWLQNASLFMLLKYWWTQRKGKR